MAGVGLESGSSSVAVGSITGLGTGVATFLATPSSANLAGALTDETGSGKAVFGTQPATSWPVEAFTGDDTLTTAESGKVCTNTGASGAVILTLPAATGSGVWFYIVVTVAQSITLEPADADDVITVNASTSTADTGNVSANTVGRALLVVDTEANRWVGLPAGAWTVT